MDADMRAHLAQKLLDNPLFEEAFGDVLDKVALERSRAKINDIETIYRLSLYERAINEIYAYLRQVQEEPKIEKFNAELAEKRGKVAQMLRKV